MRLSAKAAHKIVVNSAAVGADLVQNAHVPAGKVVLSHNGVDLRLFAPEPRVRKVFPNASLIIGALCALRPEKRLDLLLDAFAQVKNETEGLRLLIVGSGPMLAPLREQSQALALDNFCHFEPSKTEVAEWLRSIDVFVMSSESESFPNALLEAMACGCCVVGSRVGGVPELIVPDRNGLLFEPRSVEGIAFELRRVIRDSQLRGRLALDAVRTAREEFPMQAAVERIQNLYVRLLNRRPE
jgi:glycosyltransferase involved in cell wall biosynthesis